MEETNETLKHENSGFYGLCTIEELIDYETRGYISAYLDPNQAFHFGLKSTEKIRQVMRTRLNDAMVRTFIRRMDYNDFLSTPYWDGVRNYKIRKFKYQCQLCGKKGILNVHHRTYERHGMEHMRKVADSDLIVLCKECHEKFHDKL